jgi:hypothetical protein
MPIPNTQLNDYELHADIQDYCDTQDILRELIREVRAMQAVVNAANLLRISSDTQSGFPYTAMGALRQALDDHIGTGPRTLDDGPDVWQENEQLRHLLFRVANEMRLSDMYQLPDDLRQELEEYRDDD